VAALVLCQFGGCAWFDAKQREWIYRPTPGSMQDWRPVTSADKPLWLPVAAAVRHDSQGGAAPQHLRAIWIPQDDADAPAVLYLHGTFRNLFQNRPKIAAIHAAGFAVLAVEYRGFGDSTSLLPSEETIVQDSEAAWEELVRRVPEPARRAIFGHSMGGAVAVELALRHRATPPQYAALVLESTFTSLPDLARDRYPWTGFLGEALATQHFDTIDKIGQIDAPTWLLAGTADRTVSSMHSQRLYGAAGRACELVMFDGGSHSSLHEEFGAAYHQVWTEIAAQMRAADPAACVRGAGHVVHVDSTAGS
jgi:alpha-beta hydrolase superfamily lysophospholipase